MAEIIINSAILAAVAVPVLAGMMFVEAAGEDYLLDGIEHPDPETDAPEFPALATEEDLQKGAAR